MTCILKTCALAAYKSCAALAKSGLGECGAACALDLATRNDGYLVHASNNPTIDALLKAGLITVKYVDDDRKFAIARAVLIRKRPYHTQSMAWAAEMGSAG